jgi:hypothetical protein
METSPDDDEAQGTDLEHAGDFSEAEQARRRREQEFAREEAKEDEDEADASGPRPA